ncbi:MAG: hypothetical protein ABI534_00685 [Chloroflexota bacterium]
MPNRRPWVSDAVAFLAAAALALVLATELTRPLHAGPVSFDVGASVLHFERIVHGHRLEQMLTTTPKPFLTVVYGLLHAVTNDWRPISWATILAFGFGVGLLTLVARRVGGIAVAAFVGVALAGSPMLLEDVGVSLGWGWGLLWLAVAAFAVTLPVPRYVPGGLALAAAVLVRIELIVIVAGIGLVLTLASTVPRLPRPPRGAWFLLLAALAVPVMLIHDALLIGDPLFWTAISGKYSASVPDLPTFGEVAAAIWSRSAGLPILGGLAILGIVEVFRLRRWALGFGMLLLGPGIVAFMLFLALRGTFVPDRYFAPVDIALICSAGFGLHALHLRPGLVAAVRGIASPLRAGLLVAVAAFLAVAITPSWALIGAPGREVVRNQLWLAIDQRMVLPTLQEEVAERSAITAFPSGDGDGHPTFFVPVRARPAIAVDLGLSLDEVASTYGPNIDLEAGYPAVGQVVFHDLHGERYPAGFEPLETDVPAEVDGVRVVPLQVDERRGYWVVEIEPAAR